MANKMDWFGELTGLASDDPATVRAGISVEGNTLVCPNGRRMQAGRLTLPNLADFPPPPDGPVRVRVREVVADVQALHADPANAGAVFQVASQFNLLEMVDPHVTPEQGIARYATDRTQGPACAMACAAGTIWRNYLVLLAGQIGQTASVQIDTLHDLSQALGNQDGSLWQMRNGYALPCPGGLHRVAEMLARMDHAALRRMIRIGVQSDTEVTLRGGHLVTQAYCSALPVAYGRDPAAAWEPFARLVVEAAYEATLALTARQTATRRVFLTRLGGGAFGNPPDWTTDAIARAITQYRACDIEVVLVSYSGADPANRPLLALASP